MSKAKFKVGDYVNVGKAYRMGGKYEADEYTGGPYTVVNVIPPSRQEPHTSFFATSCRMFISSGLKAWAM